MKTELKKNVETTEEGTVSVQEETTQSRLKSWPLWLAMGAAVIWVVKTFGGFDISEQVNGLLNVALPVLVGFGIINNPTDKKKV